MLRTVNSASQRLPIPGTRIEMKSLVIALLVLVPSVDRAQDLAITHATIYASPEAPPRRDATVFIRSGVIAAIGEHLRTPGGIGTISCRGCVVLAGFWNAHVHFMEPKWNDAAHQPAEKLTRQMSEMLTHSGFTTVVDTGSGHREHRHAAPARGKRRLRGTAHIHLRHSYLPSTRITVLSGRASS